MVRLTKEKAIERAIERGRPTPIFPEGLAVIVVCRGSYYTVHYPYEIPTDCKDIVWDSAEEWRKKKR